jgi:hypothetical protein
LVPTQYSVEVNLGVELGTLGLHSQLLRHSLAASNPLRLPLLLLLYLHLLVVLLHGHLKTNVIWKKEENGSTATQ